MRSDVHWAREWECRSRCQPAGTLAYLIGERLRVESSEAEGGDLLWTQRLDKRRRRRLRVILREADVLGVLGPKVRKTLDDDGRRALRGVVAGASGLGDAQPAVTIEAKRIKVAELGERQCVECAARDLRAAYQLDSVSSAMRRMPGAKCRMPGALCSVPSLQCQP